MALTTNIILVCVTAPTFTPRQPKSGPWNKFNDARPYLSVMGIPFDKRGDILILYRSDKVRSAKNVWSFPSGLGEVGLTPEEQLLIELHEEFNLTSSLDRVEQLTSFQNIAINDNWHWHITLYAVEIDSFSQIINKEPDKHSSYEIISYHSLRTGTITQKKWSNGLDAIINSEPMRNKIYRHVLDHTLYSAAQFVD